MPEIDLVRKLQIRASELGHRLFRNNSGVGWAGHQTRVSERMMVWMNPGDVLVRQARPLRAGLCEGSPDLVGLTSSGRFLGVEVKSPKGRTTPAQESFIDMVNRLGGIGLFARSVEDLIIP